MLETTGDRGRELRELYKQRGGKGGEAEEAAPPKKEKQETAPPPPAKAAPAPRREEPKATAGGAEVDQLTRQVHLLGEEVGTLRERVKFLEEDNEKWRQLVGKDPLTGLPNRIFLFRIALPKSLRALPQTGPLSCIGLGLDQVARINTEQGWQVGDRMIQEAVKAVRKLLGQGEELYRLEGVNFAIFGRMNNTQARQRGVDIRRQLASASVQVEKTAMPLTASLGVVTVERQVGKSPAEAAGAIFQALIEALYRAREKGGNTVEVHANTQF
jgi:diguanylate cyclase (GGDEF)-like protein